MKRIMSLALAISTFVLGACETQPFTAPVTKQSSTPVVLPPFSTGAQPIYVPAGSGPYLMQLSFYAPADFEPRIGVVSSDKAVVVVQWSNATKTITPGESRAIWVVNIQFMTEASGSATVTLSLKNVPGQTSSFVVYSMSSQKG